MPAPRALFPASGGVGTGNEPIETAIAANTEPRSAVRCRTTAGAKAGFRSTNADAQANSRPARPLGMATMNPGKSSFSNTPGVPIAWTARNTPVTRKASDRSITGHRRADLPPARQARRESRAASTARKSTKCRRGALRVRVELGTQQKRNESRRRQEQRDRPRRHQGEPRPTSTDVTVRTSGSVPQHPEDAPSPSGSVGAGVMGRLHPCGAGRRGGTPQQRGIGGGMNWDTTTQPRPRDGMPLNR